MKISTVLERGHLQQSIEVIRWDRGPLKIVLIMARSWNSWTWNSHFDCLSQILTQFMTNFNGPRPHLMTSMICWRRLLSKTMLTLIVALTLFELETKTFGQSQSNTTLCTVKENECHTPRLMVFCLVHLDHLPKRNMTQMVYHLKALI